MKNISPLRWVGGKALIYPQVLRFLDAAKIDNNGTFIELFAGGASLGLKLLTKGRVSNIILNDLDRNVFSFWYSVLYNTEELIDLIKNAPLNITEYEKHCEILSNHKFKDCLTTGFSMFYLNRTKYYGCLLSGILGGKNQKSTYNMDSRFDKCDLIDKIKYISTFKNKIILSNESYNFYLEKSKIKDFDIKNTFFYLDPPYYCKNNLYICDFNIYHHIILLEKIKSIDKKIKWLISYNDNETIKKLYKNYNIITNNMNYSSNKKKIKELFIYSNNITIKE